MRNFFLFLSLFFSFLCSVSLFFLSFLCSVSLFFLSPFFFRFYGAPSHQICNMHPSKYGKTAKYCIKNKTRIMKSEVSKTFFIPGELKWSWNHPWREPCLTLFSFFNVYSFLHSSLSITMFRLFNKKRLRFYLHSQRKY
jgi:hypothetical protein